MASSPAFFSSLSPTKREENEKMNGFRDILPFTDADLNALAAHKRELLEKEVTHTTTLALKLLDWAGVSPADLPDLSERVSRDPDWASSFLNRCTIVVRDMEDPNGRPGAWVEDGALCVEASLGDGAVLVVRGGGCELHLTSPARPVSRSVVHELAPAGGTIPLRLGKAPSPAGTQSDGRPSTDQHRRLVSEHRGTSLVGTGTDHGEVERIKGQTSGSTTAKLSTKFRILERADALEGASKRTPSSFVRAIYQAQAQILREMAEEVWTAPSMAA
jgi:hypothetical protein